MKIKLWVAGMLIALAACFACAAYAQQKPGSVLAQGTTANTIQKICGYVQGVPILCNSLLTDTNGQLLYNGLSVTAGLGSITSSAATQLPHWLACTAKVKINAGSCRVYAIGDSTTFGTYSNGTAGGDLAIGAFPARLAQYMNNAVLPAQRDSFMGAGNGLTGAATDDARVVVGSWAPYAPISSDGGQVLSATSGPSTPLTFTPLNSVDTFRVWYITAPGSGSFAYSVDSGSATTVSENVATSVTSVLVNAGSVASHTIKLAWVSGIVYVIGVEAYNSTVASVQVINAGWPQAQSAQWNSTGTAYAPRNTVTTQSPDLILLSLGINDWNSSIPVATFQANMQALITTWKPNSDIVLVTPAPSQNSVIPLTTQQPYITAMYALAASNGVPIIDNWARWQSYERMNAAPYLFYGQSLHPNGNGYSDFAQAIASQLLGITGH